MWVLNRVILVCVLVLMCTAISIADDLKWDINLVDPNNQIGNGIWDTVLINWWDQILETNVNWVSRDSAFFDAGDGSLYTVTLDEDIAFSDITFGNDANCLITGPYDLTMYGNADSTGIVSYTPTATIDCDIYRHEDESLGDPDILVSGSDNLLTINGDIFMTGHSSKVDEDIVFSRSDVGTDYVNIIMNGDIYNNTGNDSKTGKVHLRGWNPDSMELAGTRLIMNGDLHTYDVELRLHTGAWLEVGGRLEADLINVFAKTGVADYNDLDTVLEGSDDNTGVWCVTTAGYNGSKYLKRNRDSEGKIYAVHLNLEVDVEGFDFDLDENELRLADLSSKVKWFGALHSYYAKEPAGTVGTVIEMKGMPVPGERANDDIYFIVETTDFDRSGCVDFFDFSHFAMQWQASDCDAANDWCEGCDFHHNGAVEPNDFTFVAENWLEGCGQ